MMVWETIARYLLHGLVVTLELTIVGFIGGFASGSS
ncbi:ABC-type amino acid transport system, permease component, N terminus fragment [Thermococcus gammatolerans EJ3]|uniref:ABC-type amino acid transport system, permease component, N terminus n=1 Tax=Thermococcus gammatolerans (strain DSM 15229 / JCM 11827 / EJ3) TaxID=593117 RepID=C5A2U4_THEGJ|nr:ABC-type amino acid transport system, permease component, N terminus fragment [Thermococcus gammatolerans EJ3]